MLVEVRIHGRGGQGNVVAANLLAAAAFADGFHVQAFPSFGAERRGAPVAAFVRLSDAPLRRHCQVQQPDFLIVQDESLLNTAGITAGLKPDGGVLINSTRPADSFTFEDTGRVVALDASQLAQTILHRPIPNTALISAFVGLTGLISPDSIGQALEERFHGEVLAANRTLAEKAGGMVTAGAWRMHADKGD